jgi:hypothetical protein
MMSIGRKAEGASTSLWHRASAMNSPDCLHVLRFVLQATSVDVRAYIHVGVKDLTVFHVL